MKNILLVFLSLFLAIGCIINKKPPYVEADRALDVDFTQYQTFAWLPTPDTANTSTIYDSEIIKSMARNAVEDELQKRGYELDPENPDILILVHTMYERDVDAEPTNLYGNYGYFVPGFYTGPPQNYFYRQFSGIPQVNSHGIRTVEYTEGTVVVDIIDRERQELVWRGWSQEEERDPRVMENSLDRYIAYIFDEYPVKPNVED
jgi:hypothetical protein